MLILFLLTIDIVSPRHEILANLVSRLLAVVRVTLVRVVNENLAIVVVNEWFPYTWSSIISVRWATRNNGRNVFPNVASISTSKDLSRWWSA